MSDPGQAVFLSYASQDAEAAQRICDALRAAGIEVWFDRDELVGGDSWDQKIRGQIATCALFIPVISANTQARLEGYFRREWKQAAARTHDMADEKAFLLPVVIDDTRDAEAKVPAEFKTVQWTRMPEGESSAKFCARVKALLEGEPVGRGLRTPPSAREAGFGDPALQRSSFRRFWWVLPIFGFTMALALVLREKSPQPPPAEAAVAPKPTPIHPRYASSRPEVAALLTRAFALTDRADVVRAEQEAALRLLDEAERLDPADAAIFAERALVELRYVHANLDTTPARRQSARGHATQAVSLDPKNPSARLADALTLLESNGGAPAREAAGAQLDALVAERIDRVDAYLALSYLKIRQRKPEEASALLDAAAQLPGGPGRAAFQRAMNYVSQADAGRAYAELDRALQLSRATEVLMWKAYLTTVWLGDAATGLRLMGEIPPAVAMEDYPASGKMFNALWARDYPAAVAALRVLGRDYLESGALSGPTGYYIGYALAREGKRHAAEVEWRAALAVVDERLKVEPNGRTPLILKALLLAELGDRPGAEKLLQTVRELHPGALAGSWEGHILAMQLLPPEEAMNKLVQGGAKGRFALSSMLGSIRNDPFLDHLRDHPGFATMLAEIESNPKLNPAAVSDATRPVP